MSTGEEKDLKEEVVDQPDQNTNENENSENENSSAEDSVVEEDVNEFELKYTEVNDKYLRLYSEFENFRKRTAKEKLDLIMNASQDTMSAMLPILDDLERALKSNEESADIEAVKEGINLVSQKLNNILSGKGLKLMEVKAGDNFDLDLHEAITKIPAPSDELKGKVVDVIENGYYLNEKVIRYSKVVIGE
ncbi:nucleotide exchange factor GrpE [Flavobacteriales bacterium]|nr:nucleotide exchange factor GrpE [Flavobacteriales bacterium]